MLGQVDAVLMPGGRPMPEDHVEDTVWSLSEPLGRRPSDHERLSRPLLEAGLPVLIDKPLADSMRRPGRFWRPAIAAGRWSCRARPCVTTIR